MNPQLILMLLQLVDVSVQLAGRLASTTALIRRLQAEQRDPTPEEWAALDTAFADSQNELRDAIAAARAARA
jgi:hypothetical protein